MEAALAINEERIEQAEEELVKEAPAAKTTARKMFRYSEFIDVGEGAAECEHSRDGQCEDIEHFHAWCRLPNPYQHDDIQKKGLAAKARKIRELKDPESDGAVVLDQELDVSGDPMLVEQLIDELLQREWAEDYLQAQQDIEEREEFEHITQDREEHTRLGDAERDLPEKEHSDEYKRLGAHLTSYIEAIHARLKEVQEPKRQELRDRPVEQLVEILRSRRVEEEGDRAFINVYNSWTWFVGTLKVEPHPTLRRPHLPMWEEIGVQHRSAPGTMFGEAPEVIDALKETFNELQLALQRASAGN